MRPGSDLLYSVFERNLFVFQIQDEDLPEFIDTVVQDYLRMLFHQGLSVPGKHRRIVEDDLRQEVVEMTRKKIYGFGSLSEYRAHNSELIELYSKQNA